MPQEPRKRRSSGGGEHIYVCVYIYVYVFMYVYVYVYICMCMYVHTTELFQGEAFTGAPLKFPERPTGFPRGRCGRTEAPGSPLGIAVGHGSPGCPEVMS